MSRSHENNIFEPDHALFEKIHCYLTQASRPSLTSFCNDYFDLVKELASANQAWEQTIIEHYKSECYRLSKKYLKGSWKTIQRKIVALVSNNTNAESNSNRLTEAQKKAFIDTYNKMNDEKKWRIGRKCIEDIMFMIGSQMEYEHAIHSWIFDPLDNAYEEYLDDDDIVHLTELILPSNSEVDALLDKLRSCNNQEDINQMIASSNYSWDEHFDLWWIIRTIQEIMLMFKTNKLTHFANDSSEADLVGRVWCLFDPLFEFYGFNCTRPERPSVATESLTNTYTVTGTSKNHKFACSLPDLMIVKDHFEYGCAEYGKDDRKGINIKEAVEGSLKLPKEMKNMKERLLSRISREDESEMKNIKTVGFLCNRLRMNCLVMDQPSGYACRLLRLEEVECPTKIEDLAAKLSEVIETVWKLKELLRQVDDVFKAKKKKQERIVRKRKGKILPSNVNNFKQYKKL